MRKLIKIPLKACHIEFMDNGRTILLDAEDVSNHSGISLTALRVHCPKGF